MQIMSLCLFHHSKRQQKMSQMTCGLSQCDRRTPIIDDHEYTKEQEAKNGDEN